MAKLYFKLLLAMAYLTVAFGLSNLFSRKKAGIGDAASCKNSTTYRILQNGLNQKVYRDLKGINCNSGMSVGSVDSLGLLTPEPKLQACLPPVSRRGNKYVFFRVDQTKDQVVLEVPNDYYNEKDTKKFEEPAKAPLVAIVINRLLQFTTEPLTEKKVSELRAIPDPCQAEQQDFLNDHIGIHRPITTKDASTAA